MKRLLTVLCILFLLAADCSAGLAAAPTISVGNESLTVEYSNPDAQGT